MKLRLVTLNILALLIICSYSYADRIVLLDPNPDGKITAKIYAQSDIRLLQKVSYEAKMTTVKQIVSDLCQMTGVNLSAGKNDADWPVRSRKMNIFVKDVPLCELMDSIARVMKFRWSLSDDDKMIYRLKVNIKAAAEADAMMKRADQAKEKMSQKRRQEWADVIDKYGDKSISELAALRESDPQVYEQALLGSLQAIRALFKEVPETKELFVTGKDFRIRADDVSPETKQLFYNAGNEVWKFLQRIGYVGGKKTQNPPGYGPKAVHINDPFDIVFMRKDVGHFTPNWGSNSDDTGYWHLYRNAYSHTNNDFEVSSLPYLGSSRSRRSASTNIRIEEGGDVDEVRAADYKETEGLVDTTYADYKKQEETLYPSEPLIQHTLTPELEKNVKVVLEKSETGEQMEFAEKIAAIEKAIAEASGISVVSDAYRRNIREGDFSFLDKEAKLSETLDGFCSWLNYNWDKPGPVIELHYRKWAKVRLNQIPDEWVATWSKNTETTGFLSLEDHASIAANVNYYQSQECLQDDPVLGYAGIYTKMLNRLDANLPWLKLYASLSQQQKKILFEGQRGLFGQMLTSNQWKLAKPLFDRIGITRGDSLMQAEVELGDDPKYTVWFKLIDTDTNQVYRLWKLILSRYNPPKPATKTK